MGSLRILNAIIANTEVPKSKKKRLQFVKAIIHGTHMKALVDNEVNHNFIFVDEAKNLGINYVKGGCSIKVLNSGSKPVVSVAHEVEAKIGEWEGVINMYVVPMEDFQPILWLEFFDIVCAFPMPFANSLCILDGSHTCMVSTEQGTNNTTYTFSSMQFKKGFNKHEPCY